MAQRRRFSIIEFVFSLSCAPPPPEPDAIEMPNIRAYVLQRQAKHDRITEST